MTRSFRSALALILAGFVLAGGAARSEAFGIPLSTSQAQVWVSGKQIPFSHLGIAYGDPVTPVDDPGLVAMLAAVGARSSWQPGNRFVAITRADGSLITFTLGSNAVSVDGTTAPMPFAPFSIGSQLYVPLLPLARALELGIRGFRSGYVFVPQIIAVVAKTTHGQTIVHITGSAPIAWRSAFEARAAARTLTLSFPGFGTDLNGSTPMRSADAGSYTVSESGPPGYPTTAIAISVAHGAKFAAHRIGAGNAIDVVFALTDAALRPLPSAATPSAVRVVVATEPPPTARPSPTPTPTVPAMIPAPEGSPVPPTPEPAAEPTEVATAEPLGPEPTPSGAAPVSPEPSASPQLQKITDVSVAETAAGTRVTLTFTGPVAFEWHRLADPDDRYWLDIDDALLVGPAQVLASTLPFVKEIKISQHALVPEKVVRLSITPSQGIDVTVGAIEGSPNQLGIQIGNSPPTADAPMAGTGFLGAPVVASSTPQASAPPVPTDPDLIVIDPGHGGTDPGSLNAAYGLTEKVLTLAISSRLAVDLKRQGWKVTMTRVGDYDVGDPTGPDAAELQARCDVANAAGARLFVSVHINASVSSAPNGITTYFWHLADRGFAQDVQNELVASAGITDDGVKRDSFYVIHHTVMSSILVEAAYLSNAHDAELLSQTSFLDKIAAGIARGIGDFTGGPPTPVGQNRQSNSSGSPRR